jgi:hypothetical protein
LEFDPVAAPVIVTLPRAERPEAERSSAVPRRLSTPGAMPALISERVNAPVMVMLAMFPSLRRFRSRSSIRTNSWLLSRQPTRPSSRANGKKLRSQSRIFFTKEGSRHYLLTPPFVNGSGTVRLSMRMANL